jgi:uncharacterized protein YqcC (DUF446 family)
MPVYQNNVHSQISLIQEAMKKAGLWSDTPPGWVSQYTDGRINNFWEWLQFIHLPMRAEGKIYPANYLAPQLSVFTKLDNSLQNILQLIIELDSISPTINTYESSQHKNQNHSSST